MLRRAYVLIPFAALLCACGSEVGRVPLTAEGSAAIQAPLKAGEVSFWTDIDIEYEGDATLTYDVTLEQGGKSVAKTTCDPLARLSTRMKWLEKNVGDSHSRSGLGKMACTATVPAAGPTSAKVTLAFGRKPKAVTLKKADLVLKQ